MPGGSVTEKVALPKPSVYTITSWTNVLPCARPAAGADGFEKISMMYSWLGEAVSVPESVPEDPAPGVNVNTGADANWFAPELSLMPAPAFPKIEFRVNWSCLPPDTSIASPPLNAITFP